MNVTGSEDTAKREDEAIRSRRVKLKNRRRQEKGKRRGAYLIEAQIDWPV